METIYTDFTDLAPVLNSYAHCRLLDGHGQQMIAFNRAGSQNRTNKLKAIEKRLKSPGTPDGTYFLECKDGAAKNYKIDRFVYQKGDIDETGQEIKENLSKVVYLQNPTPPTGSALGHAIEAATATIQLEHAREKIAALESELSELQNELADNARPALADRAMNWVEDNGELLAGTLLQIFGKTPPPQPPPDTNQVTPSDILLILESNESARNNLLDQIGRLAPDQLDAVMAIIAISNQNVPTAQKETA